MKKIVKIGILALLLPVVTASAAGFFRSFKQELLPVDQAFTFSAVALEEEIYLDVQIADGHYLYREKFDVDFMGFDLSVDRFLPVGVIEEDPYFGTIPILENSFQLKLPIVARSAFESQAHVKVRFQGCAKGLICYPPMERSLEL